MLEHGGNLFAAAKQYGIAPQDWLDLSTGINPHGYPVPPIPLQAWQRLPQADDGLEQAARDYYGCRHALATAGSQAALQTLPWLRPKGRVALLATSYAEHRHAWQHSGHEVRASGAEQLAAAADWADVVVACNPNNPTGQLFPPALLLDMLERLTPRKGWLVVDEAFMDATPELSLAGHAGRPGLIVLRSLGKFFGLAGARVGFVLAWPELLKQLEAALGPWPISGPARHAAALALRDAAWQQETRRRLLQDAPRLAALLAGAGLAPSAGSALFQWVETPLAADIHQQLASQGILTRLFHAPASLRFGLPQGESDWRRLEQALHGITARSPGV